GRHGPNGDFFLSMVKPQLFFLKYPGVARSLKLARAFADFSQKEHSVAGAIDANDNTGWAIHPELGKRHFAVFEFAEPVTDTVGKALRVTLEFKSPFKQHGLGRFRLSVSPDPLHIEREQKHLAALKFTDPWIKLAAAYSLNGRNDKATEYFAKAFQADPKLGD